MLCADSLEDVAVWLGLKAAQWVSARHVHDCMILAISFQRCSSRIAASALPCAQRRACTFSTRRNAGVSPFAAFAASEGDRQRLDGIEPDQA